MADLTPEQIKLLQQQNDLYRKQLEMQAEGYSLSTSYLESLKEVMNIRSRTSVSDSNILDINKKINRAISEQKGVYDTSSDVQKQILKNKKLIHQSSVQELSLSNQLLGDDEKRLKYANANISTINKKMKLLDEEKAKNSSLQDKDLIKRLQTEIAQKEKGLGLHTKSMSQAARTLLYTQKQQEELKKQNILREEEIVRLKQIEKTLGLTGALIKGIGKIPIIGNLVDTNKALKEMEKTIASGGGKFAAMGTGLKSVGKDIFTHLTDPLTILTSVTTTFFNLLTSGDKAIGDLAKGMNMSYENAASLRNELSTISEKTGDTYINTQGLQDSLLAIGQSLGSNGKLNEKDLVTFTELREKAGYTNDELIEMQKLTLAVGGSLENNVKSFAGTVAQMNLQNKLTINEKQLLKDISKTSDAIKLSVGGTTEKIAKAAFQAKQFGINLEQADKISSGLLDFESSIQNELEAELLTGKDLNLEKARLLALNGDIAGASAEILKQVESSAEFAGMNRIQQEAIAKAVGLSRDDLAKSLVEREALQKLGVDSAEQAQKEFDLRVSQVGYEQALAESKDQAYGKQLLQNSLSEDMNKLVQQLQEAFIPIANELLPKISNFFKNNLLPMVGELKKNFGVIRTIVEVIAGIIGVRMVAGLVASIAKALILLGIQGSTAAAAAATNASITFGLGAVAIIAGVAAVMGAVGGYALSDGHIGSDGGLIVSGEKGSYQLDKNDSVIAGTNLMGDGAVKSDGSKGSISFNSESIVVELQNVRSILNQILTKEGSVKMDSTQVGTSTNVGTYKVQ